jgi:hypothetical protein
MHFRTILQGTLVVAALAMTGCATTFRGPSNYVDFSWDGKAKSATTSAAVGTAPRLQSTYEDEFVYDNAGNVVKHKQTEYFNYNSPTPNFVVWETDFKVVGGVVLPYRQSANDVVYVEIDYDTLQTQAKGAVKQGTTNRRFSAETQVGFDKYYSKFNIDLSQFTVDFPADGKFVVSQQTYNPYRGFDSENVLTLGYDNIVLKHYLYSRSKLEEGVSKSYQGGLFGLGSQPNIKDSNSEFNYEWKVIGNTIAQTKTTFTESYGAATQTFVASAEYNAAGQRTSELWTVQKNTDKPVTLFQQDLKY